MSEKNEFGQAVGEVVENWQPALRPTTQPLLGRTCTLVPIQIEEHAAPLLESLSYQNTGESWTYLPYGPFTQVDEFKRWLHETLADPTTFLYVILNPEGKPVGVVGYLYIRPEQGIIEIGHVHFSKLLTRTTAATEAIYLMMRQAFDLGYRRCEWKCHSLNQASRQTAERLGFTFEGVFEQHFVVKGRNRDTAWFSVTDKRWPRLKEKFERWLDPSNFDEQNRQLAKLNAMSAE